MRPLDPPGRWRRLAPFAAVLGLGLAMGQAPPAVRPVPHALAVAVALLITAAVGWMPWSRWPAGAAAAPAFGALVIFGLLHHGSTSPASGYGPLVLVPLFWLALYHGPRLLIAGLVGAGLILVVPFMATAGGTPPQWRLVALWLAAAAIVSWTTHRLVLRSTAARAATAREHDFTSAVLDSAGFLLVVLDADGNVVRFNRRCEELTGRREDDVRGRPFSDVSRPDASPPEARAACTRFLSGAFPTGYESHWTGLSGRRLSIVWQNTVLTDATGTVTHIIASGLDVTEQRQTERTLAHVLAAATDQAIVAAGRDGVVTVFNAGAERLLGYTAEEVVGWVSPLLWHEPEELTERAASLGVVPGPAIFRAADDIGPQQWTYVRKDGSHLPVELTTSEIRDDTGEVVGFLSVARDITRERQGVEAMTAALARETAAAARLRELDRVRGDLVATVSHELRTPLTSILGNVELLADGDAGPLAGPQARLVAAVERNARRLLALIEDLLMLSRIESGAVKINARPVHMRAIVGGALEALHTTRASRGVDLEVDLPAEPLLVFGDQAQLERVLINLVDNGLKFTPPGGQVRIVVDGGDDGFARLIVSDTGMGIPADEVDSVFERFFRSSRSQERASQGTGLGLAITKTIVERHGGRIWASSGENRAGTQVVCLLPRA